MLQETSWSRYKHLVLLLQISCRRPDFFSKISVLSEHNRGCRRPDSPQKASRQTQQEMFRGLVNTPRFIGCRRTLHANNHHCCRQNYDWKGFVKNIHTTRDLVKNISNHDSQGINTSRLIEMSTRYVDDDFCGL